eukprot:COSAG05_NODE_7473_length_806_cov_1.387553_1_plen_218_part_01
MPREAYRARYTLLLLLALLCHGSSDAAESSEPCIDDPLGSLAGAGGCVAVVQAMGCAADLHSVSASTPTGTFVSALCPRSCDVCATSLASAAARAGLCADFDDGAPELGEMHTCAAAVAEAGGPGNCDRPVNASSHQGHSSFCSWSGNCSLGSQAGGDDPQVAWCDESISNCIDVCHGTNWCTTGETVGPPLLGHICARTCGWCTHPMEFSIVSNVAS